MKHRVPMFTFPESTRPQTNIGQRGAKLVEFLPVLKEYLREAIRQRSISRDPCVQGEGKSSLHLSDLLESPSDAGITYRMNRFQLNLILSKNRILRLRSG